MSYPALPTVASEVPAFLRDLAGRKEFYALRYQPTITTNAGKLRGYGIEGATAELEQLMQLIVPGFRPHGAQQFAANYCSPDTNYPNLLMSWQTGVGKSPAGVLASLAFAETFRRQAAATGRTIQITVLGFTIRATVLKEMLTRPEFGFVSATEADTLRRLRELALLGGANSEEAKRYGILSGVLRRRITDPNRGGCYRFYGYKEFANRLFGITARGTSRGFRAQHLYARSDNTADFGARLAAEAAAGNIVVNQELLESLRGGFILADEIQDVYNKQEKNNYGVAIQYTLDVLDDEAPRLLGMSATELKGSATEIVDVINLFVPRRALPGGIPLRRSDFFYPAGTADDPPEIKKAKKDDKKKQDLEDDTNTKEQKEKEVGEDADEDAVAEDAADETSAPVSKLLPGAVERIAALMAGRVSFLLDTDTASYPRRRFMGEAISEIPYLRFTPCPMSPLHERTLIAERESRAAASSDSSISNPSIPNPPNIPNAPKRNNAPGTHALYDMVFPNPADKEHGLYRAVETPSALMEASAEWRASNGVEVRKGADAGLPAGVYTIGGKFLAAGNVSKYSTKYEMAIRLVIERLRTKPGKIFLQHPRVRMSGVLLIQELLRANGFVGEEESPNATTLCARCGREQSKHKGATTGPKHEYVAARFVMAHSDVDRATMDRSIARYNSPANVRGDRYLILVGSKIVRQALDFKAVQLQILLSLVSDISMALQIFGRTSRRDSHIDLPENEREVDIYILVSVASDWKGTTQTNATKSQITSASPELWRWAEKMREFLVIQEVRRGLHINAIDGFANYERMIAADPALETRSTLEALPYKPAVRIGDITRVTDATFFAYGHSDREVHAAAAGIRVLFTSCPVWTYEDMRTSLRTVQKLGGDPALFSDGSIARALLLLMRHAQDGRAAAGSPVIVYAAPYFVMTRTGQNQLPILDYESYIRDLPVQRYPNQQYPNQHGQPTISGQQSKQHGQKQLAWQTPIGLSLKLSDYLHGAQSNRRFEARWARYVSRYLHGPRGEPPIAPIDHAMVDEGGEFHYSLLQRLVADPDSLNLEDNELTMVRDSYRRFRIVILASEVADRKTGARGALAGYITGVSAQILDDTKRNSNNRDGRDSKWSSVSLESLGIGPRLQENNIAIGFLQLELNRSSGDGDRLKLRPPLAQIHARSSNGRTSDERTVERGAVCETRPRAGQLAILQRLRGAATRAGLPPIVNPSDPCDEIKSLLLALESASRRGPRGMERGVRWLYLFHDHAPVPTAKGAKTTSDTTETIDDAPSDEPNLQLQDYMIDSA